MYIKYCMELKGLMEQKVTTSISIKVKHQLWLSEQRDAIPNFTLTKFVQDKINEEIEKQNGTK